MGISRALTGTRLQAKQHTMGHSQAPGSRHKQRTVVHKQSSQGSRLQAPGSRHKQRTDFFSQPAAPAVKKKAPHWMNEKKGLLSCTCLQEQLSWSIIRDACNQTRQP
eukprot:1146433-Pelagomonas_calceolata.AAC.5